MFDSPEYGSYVALCRELRLERRVEYGDWFAVCGVRDEPYLRLCNDDGGGCWGTGVLASDEEIIWLPRLDQWLAMLEEAGVQQIHCIWHGRVAASMKYAIEGRDRDTRWNAHAPTREEAAARLWMAVTKRVLGTVGR